MNESIEFTRWVIVSEREFEFLSDPEYLYEEYIRTLE